MSSIKTIPLLKPIAPRRTSYNSPRKNYPKSRTGSKAICTNRWVKVCIARASLPAKAQIATSPGFVIHTSLLSSSFDHVPRPITDSNEKVLVATCNRLAQLLRPCSTRHRHCASGPHQRCPAKSQHGNYHL